MGNTPSAISRPAPTRICPGESPAAAASAAQDQLIPETGASFGGGGVLAHEPGDVVVRHPRRTMTSHGVEHRGRRFRAGVENGGVATEVLSRLAGDGQAPGFGAFPE